MDHLHRLPTEILLQILQSCPDLSALFSLVNTSRRLSSIFEIHSPAKTFALVLESSVPVSVQRLVSRIIHIRAGIFKYPKWEDLNRPSRYSITQLAGHLLTVPLLRKLLRLAHRVHVLAHLCLDWCLENLRCRAQPAKDLGPPSWFEEQRTIVALWRVQYFYELKVARLKGRLGHKWTPAMLSKIGSASIDGYDLFTASRGFPRAQALTVVEFIEELKAKKEICDVGRLPCNAFRLPDPGDTDNAHHSLRCENSTFDPKEPRLLKSKVVEAPTAWTYLTKHGWLCWSCFGDIPLQRLPFEPCRKLGLFLWDQERLAELGLWPDPYRRSLHFAEGFRCLPAWLSLLRLDKVSRAVKNEDDDDW